MKSNLQKLFFILFLSVSLNSIAQNEVYWREGFEPSSTPPCDLTTINPTSLTPAPTTNVTYYFNGIGGSWYASNAYRTTGSACAAPYGANHPRFRNMGAGGTFDSGFIVTPVVDFGIQELHFTRTRATRNFSIWITNDTNATTTNWSFVHRVRSSSFICNDSIVTIASSSAKRLKIVANPGIDSDIDSIWLTSFSKILPVKFGSISSSINSGFVKLNWQIETEINTKSFIIERSVNGKDFVYVANSEAKNSKNYSWIDANAINGISYYRIKAVDKDGKFVYSSVVKINSEKTPKTELTIAPNPITNNAMNVQLNGINKGSFVVSIYSLNGSLIHKVNLLSEGVNCNKTIDLPNVPKGNYMVEVKGDNTRITKSILIN